MMKKLIAVMVVALLIAFEFDFIETGWLFERRSKEPQKDCSLKKVYRPDGTLEKEICVQDGEFVRDVREYSQTGKLQKEWDKNGNYREYSANGNVRYEFLRDEALYTKYTINTYYDDGELARSQSYWGPRLLDENENPYNGVYQYFDQDGRVIKEETYKNGEFNGPWREYYKDGELKYEFVATTGNRYVSGGSYYPDGRIETLITEQLEGPVMVKYDRFGEVIAEYKMD